MRTLIIMTTFLVCLLILASCGEKRDNQATFTGRVTGADTSIYLADVKVFEVSHNHSSTTTDSMGYFRLEGVSFEEHNINFEKEGYEPYTYNFEYTGELERPIITKLIILYQPGEEKTDNSESEPEESETE